MLEMLKAIDPEYFAGALVGLAMLGAITRNFILGWYEAYGKIKEVEKSPLTTAMSLSWDKDQIERFLQLMETIAECLEINATHTASIAKAQGIMSDKFQQTTQSKLDELLERLDNTERRQAQRSRTRD